VSGAATMPTTTVFCMMLSRLLDFRKNGLAIEKKTLTAISAAIRAVVGVSTTSRHGVPFSGASRAASDPAGAPPSRLTGLRQSRADGPRALSRAAHPRSPWRTEGTQDHSG